MGQSTAPDAEDVPEFLLFFSNVGDYVINVRLPDQSAYVKPMASTEGEAVQFLELLKQKAIAVMTFDEHPFEIARWSMNKGKKAVTLHCKKIQS